MEDHLLQRTVSEFIGTFIFLGVIVTVTDPSANVSPGIAPLAMGLILAGLVFWFGDLTGAAFNPAVTAMFWLKGDFTWQRSLAYFVAQFLAAVATFYYWKFVIRPVNTT